jgi:CHASE3 domain sensor protein
MTTQSATKTTKPQTSSSAWMFLDNLPGVKFFKNLNIGARLIIGFGVLVILTLLGAGFSYVGSDNATKNINLTADVRVPTALVSSRAQANLLKMLGDVRGYLALGEQQYRDGYEQARQEFEANLNELERYKSELSPDNQARLDQLQANFEEWSAIPGRLFLLRDDQLDREPAYRLLATDGVKQAGGVLIDVRQLIELQGDREPTATNLTLLEDLAEFEGSFAAMLSGLRGYTTTRNRIYRQEYDVNKTINDFAWERLVNQTDSFDANQRTILNQIEQNRTTFLELPDDIFTLLESERWREDLYLFTTDAVPKAERMQELLGEITRDQQLLLESDLNTGRVGLRTANRQILINGVVALILGVLLTLIFRENIAGPIVRLTDVAEEIRSGHLDVRATIEARDEIGTLAETFNNMTGQLQSTLVQVRKEKKRADDLLHVVIPIGVDLSHEKDFNRLLENMLIEAKTFCRANGGILYLRQGDEKMLRYAIIRNTSQNIALGGTTGKAVTLPPLPLEDESNQSNQPHIATYVTLNGVTLNIPDTGAAENFDFSNQQNGAEQVGYLTATSMLAIPLKNSENKVLGVLQLLDAQDPDAGHVIPFDQNLQQMMESFSALAAAALEAYIREQGLRQEIKQLRIEIDEVKRQQEVTEIIETDFFQDLQAKARTIRERGRRLKRDRSDPTESDS